jgi:alpha-mannosidase II
LKKKVLSLSLFLGWIHTFEAYFNQATKHIIDTVIKILDTNKKYKFIWAEMSFLSLWWDQATTDQRQLLKKLLNNKQLEIVTGGWVMNDEANTHYFAMIDQLIEGHQFIENNLGNIPIQSGWANDPFGYSPTMAYLLHGTGVKHMAIQR